MVTRAMYVFLLAVALVGCSHAIQLRSDPRIPAATGVVDAQTGPNGNIKLKVMVEHLAPPFKLRPGATTYVVWAKLGAEGATPQNLGALRVNDSLSGSLETVTPLRAFSIFLSPEESPLVPSPTADPLMMTPINRR